MCGLQLNEQDLGRHHADHSGGWKTGGAWVWAGPGWKELQMGAWPAGGQEGSGHHADHSEGEDRQDLGRRGLSLRVGPAGGHAGPDMSLTTVSCV